MTGILSSTLALSVFLPNVHAESTIKEMKDIRIFINDAPIKFDVPPAIKDERTLVPLRAIFEAMDANVQWDEKTKTISAIKNERFIRLAIDSDVAQVDGEDYKLDVSATIYKNRTLVPLRFVGEAFDGTVVWDEKLRKISITLPETTYEKIEAPVYVNDKVVDFGSFARIVRNGVTFLPLDAVLNNVSEDLTWERNGNEITIYWNDSTIKLFKDQNYAFIDNELIEIPNSIFEYENMLVMPISIIPKVFGGYSHYDAVTREIYIYINPAKFKHEFLEKEELLFSKPTNVDGATFVGNRRIMVSDNPENLNERTIPEENATLWHDEVQSEKNAVDHRVFGWHINEFNEPVTIAITIENLSSTNEIEVVDLKGINRKTINGWVNYDVGLPIAERALSGKMTSVKMERSVVKEGENILIKSFEVPKANTLGFLYDFYVRKKAGTGQLHYKIRTVISKNGTDVTTILEEPVAIDQTARHPRGVWKSSQLETELPVYKAGSEVVAYQISNGATDHLMTPENGLGDPEEMVKNPGHYGASYIVKIPIVNETGSSQTIRVRAGARGGIYNGAVKIDGKVYLIPTLKPLTEIANIIDYVIDDKESGMIQLEFMHAGGAALPLAIELLTIDEISDEEEDEQQGEQEDEQETMEPNPNEELEEQNELVE